jgi:hypothetical protein
MVFRMSVGMPKPENKWTKKDPYYLKRTDKMESTKRF